MYLLIDLWPNLKSLKTSVFQSYHSKEGPVGHTHKWADNMSFYENKTSSHVNLQWLWMLHFHPLGVNRTLSLNWFIIIIPLRDFFICNHLQIAADYTTKTPTRGCLQLTGSSDSRPNLLSVPRFAFVFNQKWIANEMIVTNKSEPTGMRIFHSILKVRRRWRRQKSQLWNQNRRFVDKVFAVKMHIRVNQKLIHVVNDDFPVKIFL